MLSIDYSVIKPLIYKHQDDDVQKLALQRSKFAQLTDAEFRFLLQQIEGRKRTQTKLPSLLKIADWWYPVRLSCEQCSSETTALYKAQLIDHLSINTLIDLTGGYGIDIYFMSEKLDKAYYVERNEDLCQIAAHNFSITRPHIELHNTTAETFLNTLEADENKPPYCSTLIFIDPARRSESGSKVFRLEDCEPNLITLLPQLKTIAAHHCFKLSPMVDIQSLYMSLGQNWDIHILAVDNEVKEILMINGTGQIFATNIHANREDKLAIHREQEKNTTCLYATSIKQYIYEPNAAIIKAGAYKIIGNKYHIAKLDTNTHLYTSSEYHPNFPGRVWEVIHDNVKNKKHLQDLHPNCDHTHYSIITRNYPMRPEEIRKKWKLQDGDQYYLVAARATNKPIVILCKRIP